MGCGRGDSLSLPLTWSGCHPFFSASPGASKLPGPSLLSLLQLGRWYMVHRSCQRCFKLRSSTLRCTWGLVEAWSQERFVIICEVRCPLTHLTRGLPRTALWRPIGAVCFEHAFRGACFEG